MNISIVISVKRRYATISDKELELCNYLLAFPKFGVAKSLLSTPNLEGRRRKCLRSCCDKQADSFVSCQLKRTVTVQNILGNPELMFTFMYTVVQFNQNNKSFMRQSCTCPSCSLEINMSLNKYTYKLFITNVTTIVT